MRFVIRDGYASYRGPVAGGSRHRHAAFQLAIGSDVAMVDDDDVCHRGTALVVPPMTWHRLLPSDDVQTYFIEPQCAFADRLREYDGITVADALRGLREEDLGPAATRASGGFDPRLVEAMELTLTEWQLSMPELAARVGISPQRLRSVAREALGMPLSRWRIWTRLRRAAEALAAGQSLADAAVTAGFADQAHLTRWMREMIGLTPTEVLPALRGTPSAPRSSR
ncbi:AraC family transcriptional regulator [Kribbella kalugense]|uniref:AraC family transcriptional regulator n=1 Tax=Kribbella kalugense TaxID=2512221 RepID=A0A4V3G871_9ACTN|nr:AraC family transcriptional regulator [Kribbella kalugense]TDW21804.1 AraC family transcriptional regulator [Kribbella kalugense]